MRNLGSPNLYRAFKAERHRLCPFALVAHATGFERNVTRGGVEKSAHRRHRQRARAIL